MDEFGVFFWSKTEMWDSLLKKCVVADCKLEKHKLPLIDHKLSKTVESGDSRDSVDSVFATPGGVEIGSSFNAQRAPHTTLRVTYALKSPRAKGWSATR